MLEKLFKLKDNNTDVRTEVLAGITTFMTMAYILAVNPSILAVAGMGTGVFTGTTMRLLRPYLQKISQSCIEEAKRE